MRRIVIMLSCLILALMSNVSYAEQWWQKWDSFPKVPKITADRVKSMMLAGEKIAFVYAGYKVDEVVCGSFYIPYTKVPPISDGSKVNFRVPKDHWVMVY